MRPIRTENSNHNFGPPRGCEHSIGDLPCQWLDVDGVATIRSVWEPSDEERAAIGEGGNVELDVGWIGAFPPAALNVTEEKPPYASESRRDCGLILCCNCGNVTAAALWTYWRWDLEEGDRLEPAPEGWGDPICRCPACRWDHRDDDGNPGFDDLGTLSQLLAERERLVADGWEFPLFEPEAAS